MDSISGFLTALAVPLLISAFSTFLATFGMISGAGVISAALVGPILGCGSWTGACGALRPWPRSSDARVAVAPAAIGVGLGFRAGPGDVARQTASDNVTGFSHPWVLVIAGLAGAGATVVSAALGEMWADVIPGFATPTAAWLIGLAVNALLFSSVLWAANLFQEVIDLGGWEVGRWVLVADLASPAMTVIVLVVAAAAIGAVGLATASRRGAGLADRGRRAAGVAAHGSPSVAGRRRSRDRGGPGRRVRDHGLPRHRRSVRMAPTSPGFATGPMCGSLPGTSVAASIVLQLLVSAARCGARSGRRGPRGPTSSAGFFIFNAALGGGWDARCIGDFVQVAVVLGFYGTLIVSIGSLLRWLSSAAGPARGHLRSSSWRSRSLVSAVLAVACSLVGSTSFRRTTSKSPPRSAEPEQRSRRRLRRSEGYLLTVLPEVEERYLPALAVAAQVDAGQFAGTEVEHLQTDVQQPLAELVDGHGGAMSQPQLRSPPCTRISLPPWRMRPGVPTCSSLRTRMEIADGPRCGTRRVHCRGRKLGPMAASP